MKSSQERAVHFTMKYIEVELGARFELPHALGRQEQTLDGT
jgi:hypothetical protein